MEFKLENYQLFFQHDTFLESFLKNRETDCVLYSIEGTKFNIHKEILYQSNLLRNISLIDQGGCCKSLEIFCPCSESEIESILNFLYEGTVYFDSESEVNEILGNLTKTLGFPGKLFNVEILKETEILKIEEGFENEVTLEEMNGCNKSIKYSISRVEKSQPICFQNELPVF